MQFQVKGHKQPKSFTYESGKLNDDMWHNVHILKQGREILIKVRRNLRIFECTWWCLTCSSFPKEVSIGGQYFAVPRCLSVQQGRISTRISSSASYCPSVPLAVATRSFSDVIQLSFCAAENLSHVVLHDMTLSTFLLIKTSWNFCEQQSRFWIALDIRSFRIHTWFIAVRCSTITSHYFLSIFILGNHHGQFKKLYQLKKGPLHRPYIHYANQSQQIFASTYDSNCP